MAGDPRLHELLLSLHELLSNTPRCAAARPSLLLALTMTPASAKWVEKRAQNLKVFFATRAAHDPRAAAKMADARVTTVSVGVTKLQDF